MPSRRDLRHRLVGERPVVAAGAEVDQVIRQAVAQARRAQFLDELQVLAPVPVVAALLQQVAPERAARADPTMRGLEHSMPVAKAKSQVRAVPLGRDPCAAGATRSIAAGVRSADCFRMMSRKVSISSQIR